MDLANLVIPAGSSVRWLVTSGPDDAETAAWEGAIVMQVLPV